MSAQPCVIAIDGPAASGKSTVSLRLAERLDFGWINSGAFYRALTWWMLRGVSAPFTAEAAAALLGRTRVRSFFRDRVAVMTLDDMDPTPHLREEGVNDHVSPVSQLPVVRDLVSREIRALAAGRPCVVEGRDIGTCVFPDTPHKFFVDASPEERRRRRAAEGQTDRIEERDRMDAQRALAPLVAAADATVIDSMGLSGDGVVAGIAAGIGSGSAPAAR
jgi:cytidylate kinase